MKIKAPQIGMGSPMQQSSSISLILESLSPDLKPYLFLLHISNGLRYLIFLLDRKLEQQIKDSGVATKGKPTQKR